MIEAMQVSLENLGQDPPAPGWYYNSVGGWYYVDVYGNAYWGNPYTGQLFVPLAFHAEYEYPATNIRSDAPIGVLEGDTIQVSFSFKYKGDAQSLVFRFGNCRSAGLGNYDEAATNTKAISVSKSVDFVSYSGSGTFVFSWSLIEAKHLFILPQGLEYDVVYLNAFKTVPVAEITDLAISNYVRA